MADTLCHATQGGLMVLLPLFSRFRKKIWLWILAFVGAILGALPDLLGAYGNFVLRDHWNLYGSAHHGRFEEILQFIPMYWLHLWVDKFMHGPKRRWWIYDERMWLEVLMWILNLAAILWLVYRYRALRKQETL